MADGHHFENSFIATTQQELIRFQRNLVGECRLCLPGGDLTKYQNFAKSKWRTAAILKMVLSLYLSRKSSDLNAILCAATNYVSKDGHMTKCHNFANSTWRMAAIMKIVFRLYLDEMITAKFRTTEQNYSDTGYVTKIFRQSTFEPR